MVREIHKTEREIDLRKQQKEDQGFWVCEKCGTKYYAGINCDTCLRDEFINEMKKLVKKEN